MNLKQNVGIDLSMDELEVNLSVLQNTFEKKCLGSRKFPNNDNGFEKLLDWIDKRKDPQHPESYTLEFTGIYYEKLAYFLRENGKVVHMVIPSKSKKYCESLSVASKTDKLDARSLAWMGLERKLPEWQPISTLFLSLRTLTREREELLKDRTITANRLHAGQRKKEISESTIKRYQIRLELIAQQLEEIEKEIKALIRKEELLHENFQRVLSIPGVAWVTLATVLAETDGFASIRNQKQLTSYAGYDIKLKESGKFKGQTKISKQGNAHIRRVLHFPAQTAITYNKPLSTFYERVNTKKAKSMIAGVAVQRKLLCQIYAIWKSGEVYDPHYETNKYFKEYKKNRMAKQKPSYAG